MRWEVDPAKISGGVRDLAHDLLTIEATGDYAGAKKMLDTLGVMRPEMKATLAPGRSGAGGYPADFRDGGPDCRGRNSAVREDWSWCG